MLGLTDQKKAQTGAGAAGAGSRGGYNSGGGGYAGFNTHSTSAAQAQASQDALLQALGLGKVGATSASAASGGTAANDALMAALGLNSRGGSTGSGQSAQGGRASAEQQQLTREQLRQIYPELYGGGSSGMAGGGGRRVAEQEQMVLSAEGSHKKGRKGNPSSSGRGRQVRSAAVQNQRGKRVKRRQWWCAFLCKA